jgi:hypothetical protein
MRLFLSFMTFEVARIDPPNGGISPLAWTIIIALATVISATVPALWKMNRVMYRDLRQCNERSNKQEDEILGLLKVVRVQMEVSKGGKSR